MGEMFVDRGRPVPWITRWTSEVRSPRLKPWMSDDGFRLGYEDETPEDRIEGVLWQREGDSPGQGEPMWKDVHSHRQRRCQVEGRCQVCGEAIEGVIPWVIPHRQYVMRISNSLTTDVAPTCNTCIDLALKVCPALNERSLIYDVRQYRPFALFGDLVESSIGPVTTPLRLPEYSQVRHFQGEKRINGYLGNMMARQMIVQLSDFRKRRT